MKRFAYVAICVFFVSIGCRGVQRDSGMSHPVRDGWVFNCDEQGVLKDAHYIENGEVRYLLDWLPNAKIFSLDTFEKKARNGLTVALVDGKVMICCVYRNGRPFSGRNLIQDDDETSYVAEYSDYKIVSKQPVPEAATKAVGQ